MRCVALGHDVRSIAREASAAPAATFKRSIRKRLTHHRIFFQFRESAVILRHY